MSKYIREPQRLSINAHSSTMRELLGLGRKGKLPAEGMPSRLIDGIRVWVEPLKGEPVKTASGYTRKRSTHRVMAQCPDCSKTMSAGRLHQHVCTVAPTPVCTAHKLCPLPAACCKTGRCLGIERVIVDDVGTDPTADDDAFAEKMQAITNRNEGR